jgi:hypothetical protein
VGSIFHLSSPQPPPFTSEILLNMAKKNNTFGTLNADKKGPLGGKHGTSAKKRSKSTRSPRKPEEFRVENSDDDDDVEDDDDSDVGGSDVDEARGDHGDGIDNDDGEDDHTSDGDNADDDGSDDDSDESDGLSNIMKAHDQPKLTKADVDEFKTGVNKLLVAKLKEVKERQADRTLKKPAKFYPMGPMFQSETS